MLADVRPHPLGAEGLLSLYRYLPRCGWGEPTYSVVSVPVKIASAAGAVRSAGTESCAVGHRSTKVCIQPDGCALASVRVARGLESAIGVGSEFVVLVFSHLCGVACRHQSGAICNQGVGGEFGAQLALAGGQVGQGGRLGRAIQLYRVGSRGNWNTNNVLVFGRSSDAFFAFWELTQEPSPGRAMSLVHIRYPTAQCGREPRGAPLASATAVQL